MHLISSIDCEPPEGRGCVLYRISLYGPQSLAQTDVLNRKVCFPYQRVEK